MKSREAEKLLLSLTFSLLVFGVFMTSLFVLKRNGDLVPLNKYVHLRFRGCSLERGQEIEVVFKPSWFFDFSRLSPEDVEKAKRLKIGDEVVMVLGPIPFTDILSFSERNARREYNNYISSICNFTFIPSPEPGSFCENIKKKKDIVLFLKGRVVAKEPMFEGFSPSSEKEKKDIIGVKVTAEKELGRVGLYRKLSLPLGVREVCNRKKNYTEKRGVSGFVALYIDKEKKQIRRIELFYPASPPYKHFFFFNYNSL